MFSIRLISLALCAAWMATIAGAAPVDRAARHLKTHWTAALGPALVAHASPEGHWTFLNAAGERFTAGTPDELKRVVPMLARDAEGQPVAAGGRLTLILTEDTVFGQRGLLKDASAIAGKGERIELMIAMDGGAYKLLRRGEGTAEKIYAEVRPSVLVELSDRALFDETVWQLAHPMRKGSVRVIALEPGGPQTLSRSPKVDIASSRALTDIIDPGRLAEAFAGIRGQTAILTGRIDGDLMHYRPSLGFERSLNIKDLTVAAEAADVNLVVLQSTAPRQPGARSWLWQRVSVTRLDEALERQHLADFLNVLGTPAARLLVSATVTGRDRVALKATPVRIETDTLSSIGDALSDMVSDVAGRVVVSGVEASLKSRQRQGELDRRLVPGVPSAVQIGYGVLMLLGLVGLRPALAWWRRIWPAESREGYGNRIGYEAARATRLALFVLAFMPLAGPASGPIALLRLLRRQARAPDAAGRAAEVA